MKSGVIISAIIHSIILVLLILGVPWDSGEPREAEQVTEVTLLSASEFDAAVSNAPVTPEMDFAAMMAPTAEANDASRPQDTIAPTETEMDVTEDPTERDVDPDLTALEQVAQPEVAVTTAQPFTPTMLDAAPSISTNTSPTFGSGISGNSPTASLSRPPVPRSAPRIDTFASPPPPDDARPDTQSSDATTPDPTATETVEEQTATAAPESVTEIVPEAQPDAPPSAAPPRATRPPRRSDNVARAAAAAADVEAAVEQARLEAEEDEARELLDQLIADSAATETTPHVALSGGQRQGIIEAVSRNWNKSIIIGKENYERLVITLEVRVASNGQIIAGSVLPVTPATPTGDFLVAYDAARRSVLRAEIIPIPAEQYPQGVRLELTFDPTSDTAGIN